jgi:hypothetical protein
MSLPDWAVAVVYEYDLGMSTDCYGCGNTLKEGSTVYADLDDGSALYCSEECVKGVET